MSGDHNQYQKPDYVDRRQWKYDPMTGEPLVDDWPLYSGLPKLMKPTQEQVIAWAREAGLWPAVTDTFPSEAERLAALAYEAGRKDENEAIADAVSKCDARATPKGIAAAIRARREQ